MLLFYRSGIGAAIQAVGVVEDTLVTSNQNSIARFVGQRTVYSYRAIEEMAADGEVLAVLFRQARSLLSPISMEALRQCGAIMAPPQSITKVSEDGVAWLMSLIEQPS